MERFRGTIGEMEQQFDFVDSTGFRRRRHR
jgi:hypothetical protein